MRNPEFLHRMGKSDIEASRSVINMAKDFAELNRLENEAGIQAPEAGTKEQLVNKFVKAWENETARRAVKGGTGLSMALTLAACGGSSGGVVSTRGTAPTTPIENL